MSDIIEKIKAINNARKITIDAIKNTGSTISAVPFNDASAINDLINSEADRVDQNLFYLKNKVPMVSSFIKLNTLPYRGVLNSPLHSNSRYRIVENAPGLYLMPESPEEGDVIGMVDDGRISGSIDVVLSGNGLLIDGHSTVALNGNSVNTHFYFFQGQWRRIVSSSVKLYDVGCKTNANGTVRITNDTITQYITATPNDEMELPTAVPVGYEDGGALVSAVPRAFVDETGYITFGPKSAMTGKPTIVYGAVDLGIGNIHTGKMSYIPYIDAAGKKWFYVIVPVMYHANASVRPVVVLKADMACNASVVATLTVGTDTGSAISTCSTTFYDLDETNVRVYVSKVGSFTGGAGGKLYYFDLDMVTGACTEPTEIAYRTDTIRFADMLAKKIDGKVYLAVQSDNIKNGGSTLYGGSGGAILSSDDGINFTLDFTTPSSVSGRSLAINAHDNITYPGGKSIIFSISTRSVSKVYGSATYTDSSSSLNSAIAYITYINGTLTAVKWYTTSSDKYKTAYRNQIYVGATAFSNMLLGNDFHVIEDYDYIRIYSNAGQYVLAKPSVGSTPTLVESHLYSVDKEGFYTYHEIGLDLYMTPLTPTKDVPTQYGAVVPPTSPNAMLKIGSFNLDGDTSTLPVDVELTSIRLI